MTGGGMGREGSEVVMEEEVASEGDNESEDSEGKGVGNDEGEEGDKNVNEADMAKGSESEGEDLEKAEGSNAEGSKVGAEEEGVGSLDEEGEIGYEVQKSEEEGRNVEQEEAEVPCENAEKKVGESEEASDLKTGEEIETEIVLVDDLTSDDKGTPTDERTARRHSRRFKSMDDVAPARQPQTLRLIDEEGSEDDTPQVQDNPARTEDVSPAALEERYAAERKRKGKQEARPRKKKPRQASTKVVINEPAPETIRVPFAASAGEESKLEGSEEEAENPPPVEEGVYEIMEVLVTRRLLETMVQFSDPKQTQECEGRVGNGKVAKAGKRLCLSDLRDLGADEKFISYFKSIGFEWLLDHCDEEVPVPLAKEFFTSFRFKPTTDPDADSISFRLFNQEMEMSIREWSLRMGLFTLEEDDKGSWNEREIGPPKNTAGFIAEDAWKMLTHKKGGKFKTSYSKGIHIADPVLRIAQVYIGYNLLGQVGATVTTPELYFMWCMLKGVKVHLGYWMAIAINAVRTRADRHLYTCNLLGAFIKRNVAMTIASSVTHLPLCDAPGNFDLPFFFNKGLTTIREGAVVFYEVGKQEGVTVKAEKEETEVKATDADDRWKARMEEMVVSQKGMMTVQTEKLTQAVDVMMKMYTLFERRMMAMTPTESNQPAPGTSTVKPASSTPAVTPTEKAKGVTTTTASVPVTKENPRPTGQKARKNDDEPVPPPPKKTKLITRKSGPQGDQSQN